MLNAIMIALFAATVSASAITLLAYLCARRRSAVLFVVSVVGSWLVAGSLFGYYASVSSLVPDRIPMWRHVLAALIVIAPLALVPAAFTLSSVLGGATVRRILVLAGAGSIVALPLVMLAVIPSACYVAQDCL